ncbi:MAG TPA: hypothetical protein PLO69_11110 [Gammaproteobacteria bacterium]|nr:hypothetical protein [Gammaproteobacteria bacterium]
MTTYTVFNSLNAVYDTAVSGLSLADAARTLLWTDSHDFEIRRTETGHDLFITPFSRASTLGSRPMVKSRFFSLSDDPAVAEAEIFTAVVNEDWHGLEAMTDEAFLQMEADFKAQLAADDE